jgi:hypothetical protein
LEQLVTIDLFGQSYTFKTDSEVFKAEEVAFEIKRNDSEFINDISQRLNRIICTLDEYIV